MVGLLPLAAPTVFRGETVERHPDLLRRLQELLERHPELRATTTQAVSDDGDRILSILDEGQLRRVLRYVLDEEELLNKVSVFLGGRASEKLHLSKISTGAADDLVKVETSQCRSEPP